jgi:uncharacterized protein (DUF433 family)
MRAGAAKIAHPCIVNTRIRVSYLVDLYRQYRDTGLSDEEAFAQLALNYEHLSTEALRAALDYWQANQDEIEREILEDDAAFAGFEMLQRSLERIDSHR